MADSTGILIFLLDRSGSMGRSFGGKARLEVAKDELVRHLGTLHSAFNVIICAFGSHTSVVYNGPASNHKRIRSALATIHAEGGTNLDEALHTTLKLIHSKRSAARTRVVIVSDGEWPAEISAESPHNRLEALGVTVAKLLIGSKPAKEVLASGAQRPSEHVTEPADFSKALGAVAGPTTSTSKPAPRLAFTAMHAAQVRVNEWHDLVFSAHAADMAKKIRKQLQEKHWQMTAPHAMSESRASRLVGREAKLTVTPIVAGVEFNPPSHDIYMLEEIQETMFRFRAVQPSANGVWTGVAEVYAENVMVATVPLNIEELHRSADSAPDRKKVTTSEVWRYVFASYARTDANMVDAIVAAYGLVGAEVLLDRSMMRSGAEWRSVVQDAIDRADVFQLFWSKAASISAAVEWEWRQALKASGKATPFIRPVTWESPYPPAPAELAHLHFESKRFAALFQQALDDEVPADTLAAFAAGASSQPPAVVLAAGTMIPDDIWHDLSADCHDAVQQVEKLTGLFCPVVQTIVRGSGASRPIASPPADEAAPATRADLAEQPPVDLQGLCAEIIGDFATPRWREVRDRISQHVTVGRPELGVMFSDFVRGFSDVVEYLMFYIPPDSPICIRLDGVQAENVLPLIGQEISDSIEVECTIGELLRVLVVLRGRWSSSVSVLDTWLPTSARLPEGWPVDAHRALGSYLVICSQTTWRFGSAGSFLGEAPTAITEWLSPRWWRSRDLLACRGVPGIDGGSNALATVQATMRTVWGEHSTADHLADGAAELSLGGLRSALNVHAAQLLETAGRPRLTAGMTSRSVCVEVDVALKDSLIVLFEDLGQQAVAPVLATRWHAATLACEHLRAFLLGQETVSPYRDEDVAMIGTFVRWFNLHLVRGEPFLRSLVEDAIPMDIRDDVDRLERLYHEDGSPAIQHLFGLFAGSPRLVGDWLGNFSGLTKAGDVSE